MKKVKPMNLKCYINKQDRSFVTGPSLLGVFEVGSAQLEQMFAEGCHLESVEEQFDKAAQTG